MPTHFLTREQELPLPDNRAVLGRMPNSAVPVIHQTWNANDPLPYWAFAKFSGNHLFDLAADPTEEDNLAGGAIENEMIDLLKTALSEVNAPDEQWVRLGLK
jgi:hypothetical protein